MGGERDDITEFLPPAGELDTQELPPSDVVSPGTTIGEYVVERQLGQGGMGTVYLARHPIIEKRAAIKLLQGRVEERLVERLVNEARAVNRIRHLHIVDVFSFGRLTDGRPYIVMEYLDGEPLEARLARSRLELDEAFRLVEQIADALEATHREGIVHRDLKPANVFLVKRGSGTPMVKLLDFGVAKLSSDASSPTRTADGLVIGTPAYLAPEQAASRPVSAATDVYSLGVMLFEMLVGCRPFYGSSSVEIASKHLHQKPPRASEVGLALPRPVDDLLARMLAKAPEERPTLGEVRAVAAQVRAGLPARRSRRHLFIAAAALSAVAIAAAVGLALSRSDGDRAAPREAVPAPQPVEVVPPPADVEAAPIEPSQPGEALAAAEPEKKRKPIRAKKKTAKKKQSTRAVPEPGVPDDAPIDPLSGMRP